MKADETISFTEAEEIFNKYLTEESKALLEDKFDLESLWQMSIRKGVVRADDDVPVALAGVCVYNLRNVFWLIPLEGMRKRVREFIKFIKTLDFEGELYTFADDPRAKLIKLAGGKEIGNGIWKVKE